MAISPRLKGLIKEAGEQVQDISRGVNKNIAKSASINKLGGFKGVASAEAASIYTENARKEIVQNFSKAGGKNVLGRTAVRSAAVGAGVGAVTSAAQGEDVWEGAARGGAIGAIGGATVRGSRMAMGVGKGQGFMDAAKGFNNRHHYTDSVKTLMQTARDTRASTIFTNPLNR